MDKKYTIAVSRTGYVGLSIATLLSQRHKVYAVDIVPEKMEKINNRVCGCSGKFDRSDCVEQQNKKRLYCGSCTENGWLLRLLQPRRL
jgi:UDP-glucose 6-dehydrogenase